MPSKCKIFHCLRDFCSTTVTTDSKPNETFSNWIWADMVRKSWNSRVTNIVPKTCYWIRMKKADFSSKFDWKIFVFIKCWLKLMKNFWVIFMEIIDSMVFSSTIQSTKIDKLSTENRKSTKTKIELISPWLIHHFPS